MAGIFENHHGYSHGSLNIGFPSRASSNSISIHRAIEYGGDPPIWVLFCRPSGVVTVTTPFLTHI
jgi:hypothetical protein